MGSFSYHKLRAEKTNAILNHRQLRQVANLFRCVEVCVVLVLISRLSFQLPIAVKNASEYFHGFSVFMVSPHFVFLIGNVIIVTLFVQSGQFIARASARTNDIYEEFIHNSTKSQILEKQSTGTGDSREHPKKQSIRITGKGIRGQGQGQRIDRYLVKYPEKGITKTEDRIKDQRGRIMCGEKQSTKTGGTNTSLVAKDYRRCESEIIRRVESEKPCRVLRRCETDNSRRSDEEGKTSYPEDGMSNEEFRRTIEAFIARQQRLRRQEQYLAP